MSYLSHKLAPNRFFDHLYDPLFTTSSWKDVARKNMISLRRSAPTQIFPVYQNMFTELTYETRNQYTLLQNPVPYFEQPVCASEGAGAAVTGADRAKYFSNPITNVHTINVQLAESVTPVEDSKKLITRGCQTMYRESSAQTTPWMPTAVIHSGEKTPEIVHVANMIEGFDFPGMKEVQIIERSRLNDNWEGQLPNSQKSEDVLKRHIVREAFEWDTWLQREAEIEKCQDMRYEMLMEMFEEREMKKKEYLDMKMQKNYEKIQREREDKYEKIRQEHQRKLRKLEKKHKAIMKVPKKETELPDYIETITVPLPPKRKVSPTMTQFESDYLAKTDHKPPATVKKYLKTRDPLWKPKEEVKETQKGLWSDKVLGELYDSLRHFRQMSKDTKPADLLPQCTVMVSSPTESEVTLHHPEMGGTTEEAYQDAVLVQKYIKGRAIQNLIWRGREQCNDLIDELQSSQRILAVKQLFDEKTEELTRQKFTEEAEVEIGPPAKPDIRPNCHILLQFLSKEIERLQDERKEQAKQLLEERERQRTNARKEEEVYRNIFKAEHDIVTTYLENVLMEGISIISEEEAREHITKIADGPKVAQVLKFQIIPEILGRIPPSNFDLISDVLNDFLTYDVIKKLENQELDSMEQTTAFMNDFVVPELLSRAATHNVWTDTQKEEMLIASELIQEFVAPEIFKILAREKQKRSRQAHLLAAHDAIWQAIEEMPVEIIEQETKLTKTCSIDATTGEIEVHHVIDDCIYRAMKMVHDNSTEEDEVESGQLSLQKELLNRIVNNLKDKLTKQMESDTKRSSSRASVDIYLDNADDFTQFPVDDED